VFQKLPEITTFNITIENDQANIEKIMNHNAKVGIWGAGIKGRIWLQLNVGLKGFKEKVVNIFDSDPDLQGLYVANCNKTICVPNEKSVNRCDCIIVTAIEYEGEIVNMIRNNLGFQGVIYSIRDLQRPL
jgi:hypothetical protein